MNRKVCEKCRRYGGPWDGNKGAWSCAEDIWSELSEVIPEHRFLNRDKFHPITEERLNPPEWCERPLEQVILSPNEDVDIKKDAAVLYDGNHHAEHRAEWTRGIPRERVSW